MGKGQAPWLNVMIQKLASRKKRALDKKSSALCGTKIRPF
jgi:hypothetical protein